MTSGGDGGLPPAGPPTFESARPSQLGIASERRVEEIARLRKNLAYKSVVGTVLVSEIFFAAFAIGAQLGPAPLNALELAIGSFFAFLVGSSVAWSLARRRLEELAEDVVQLREGSKSRRLAFHADYLAIDQEIVVAVGRAQIEHGLLTLAYFDPRAGARQVRSFRGSPQAVARALREAERLALTHDDGLAGRANSPLG